ncbi:MAG: hypothetical protein J7513_01870 [Solirubrobacteraceae bacterium]|nr:hypothetical protein [Solirubrobacteraceae bacterium]
MSSAPHPLRPSLLDDGLKLAALAAAVFLISLFLPWFTKSALPEGAKEFATTSLSAFGAFSWIEAALLLVDAAVLLLLYLRSTNRRVELPTDDGTMVAIAGGWMLILLVIRVVFAKPEVASTATAAVAPTVGLQWGLLIAMGAAGGMLAAGLATRAFVHAARTPAAAPDTDLEDDLESQVPARWRRPRA